MSIIIDDIPCPVLKFEEPDSYLILFKDNQRWIYECSLGYGEINRINKYIRYIFNGCYYHRENGPAIIHSDGTKVWFQNGRHHRLGHPAVEYPNGTKYWYKEGKKHRLDGPAVEYFDGHKEYWINGTAYSSEKDYLEKIERINKCKKLY